jgi:hypothetical protein
MVNAIHPSTAGPNDFSVSRRQIFKNFVSRGGRTLVLDELFDGDKQLRCDECDRTKRSDVSRAGVSNQEVAKQGTNFERGLTNNGDHGSHAAFSRGSA